MVIELVVLARVMFEPATKLIVEVETLNKLFTGVKTVQLASPGEQLGDKVSPGL